MRRHLGGHGNAAFLASAHCAQRLPRSCARRTRGCGALRHRHVALDHDRLGDAGNAAQAERPAAAPSCATPSPLERRILAVIDHEFAEHRRTRARRRIRSAVAIGLPSSVIATQPEPNKSPISVSCSPRSDRHRADRAYTRARFASAARFDELRHRGVVVDRIGVRHARHGREPPATADAVPVAIVSLCS